MTAARKLTAEQRAACVWARPELRLVKLTPVQLSRAARIAEACWRLHDGMPAVWALFAAIVLLSSIVLTVGIAAVCLGWRP